MNEEIVIPSRKERKARKGPAGAALLRVRVENLLAAIVLAFAVAGCGDSSRRYEPPPEEPAPAPHVPTPEEELGIRPPGVLDAAVAAWARNNELGDCYEQSQERLELARGKLLEDYRVRKGMDAAPTSFTKEWLGKYREYKRDDDALRLHILECYSRGVVKPLPDILRGRFTSASERRRQTANLVATAPNTLDGFERDCDSIESALGQAGSLSWETRKSLDDWSDLAATLGTLSSRAKKLASDVEGLASRISRLAAAKPEDDGLSDLERRASRIRRKADSLSLRVSDALGIAEGQTALATFAEECRRMDGWIRVLDARNEAKAARIAEEKEWRRRVILARKSGNHADISSAAAALPRFQAAMANDKSEGDVARGDVKAFKKYADANAFRQFKGTLPEGARAGADTLLEGVFRSIPNGRNPKGFLEVLESKAFKLHDDYEEKTALAELESTVNR